jgi:hypothetical protein
MSGSTNTNPEICTMQLSLTNNTDEPEVIADPDGTWADALTPNTPYDMDNDLTVVIVGDKPDVREQIQQAAKVVTGVAKHMLALIAGRQAHAQATQKPAQVSAIILNRGGEPVRVILGNGTTDTVINPGGSNTCMAPGYLEIRELGGAPQEGGTG